MEENLKIEILFPEFCNLYGDISNMKYLKKCLPNANFIETAFDEEPTFIKEKVNFIYLGPMTESMQEKVITKLRPYSAAGARQALHCCAINGGHSPPQRNTAPTLRTCAMFLCGAIDEGTFGPPLWQVWTFSVRSCHRVPTYIHDALALDTARQKLPGGHGMSLRRIKPAPRHGC